MKVLVVDDDRQICQVLDSFLTEAGWIVQITDNAERAMEKLDDTLDVVLTDIQMGQTSGIDLLRTIRERYPFLEVVLMTGFADLQDSIEALSLRAFAYLKKPFDLTELNQKLIEAARQKDANTREEFYKRSLEEQVASQTRQLRIEKEKFQTIFSTVPSLLLVFDRRLVLLDGNSFLERHTGLPVSRMAGEHLGAVLKCKEKCLCRGLQDMPDNCPIGELIRPVIENRETISRGQVKIDILDQEAAGSRIFRGSCCRLPAKTEDEPLYLMMLEEITREKEMELQIIHSSRMTALGEMAAGVAHELNQPLNGIAGYIQLMENRLTSGKDPSTNQQLEFFRETMQEVKRMSEIINNLGVFSRSDTVTRLQEPVDVRSAYRNSMNLLHAQIEKYGIEVQEDLQNELPPISGDSGKLQQVFMNLLVNARDALCEMASQSTGVIRKTIRVSAGSMSRKGLPGVLIEVSDNGPGIPQQNLKSIFDPFFTTKDPGKGTGLGLSISYGIVRDFGGSIEVISEPGAGACFSIWLPCYSGKERAVSGQGGPEKS